MALVALVAATHAATIGCAPVGPVSSTGGGASGKGDGSDIYRAEGTSFDCAIGHMMNGEGACVPFEQIRDGDGPTFSPWTTTTLDQACFPYRTQQATDGERARYVQALRYEGTELYGSETTEGQETRELTRTLDTLRGSGVDGIESARARLGTLIAVREAAHRLKRAAETAQDLAEEWAFHSHDLRFNGAAVQTEASVHWVLEDQLLPVLRGLSPFGVRLVQKVNDGGWRPYDGDGGPLHVRESEDAARDGLYYISIEEIERALTEPRRFANGSRIFQLKSLVETHLFWTTHLARSVERVAVSMLDAVPEVEEGDKRTLGELLQDPLNDHEALRDALVKTTEKQLVEAGARKEGFFAALRGSPESLQTFLQQNPNLQTVTLRKHPELVPTACRIRNPGGVLNDFIIFMVSFGAGTAPYVPLVAAEWSPLVIVSSFFASLLLTFGMTYRAGIGLYLHLTTPDDPERLAEQELFETTGLFLAAADRDALSLSQALYLAAVADGDPVLGTCVATGALEGDTVDAVALLERCSSDR